MKILQRWAALVFSLFVAAGNARAAEWFVATNGNDAADGTNWAMAKLTIQAGVDAAASNDTVWVSNGVYATGGGVVAEGGSNRVAIDKSITVQSVNGPETTCIVGDGMRGVCVASGAWLSGFTVTNGFADYGGGVWCEQNGMVTNCVLIGNTANGPGGGSYGGKLYNCLVTGNGASDGGGSYAGKAYHCILANNSATSAGGGAYGVLLENCLLVSNSHGGACSGWLADCTVVGNSDGYGVYGANLYNCIVVDNAGTGETALNHFACIIVNSCTTPSPGGLGNITNDPQFVDAAAGNYRLGIYSPCLNAGSNAFVYVTTDLDGNARIVNDVVDMGAYELPPLAISPASTNLPGPAASGNAVGVRSSMAWMAATNVPWLAITSGESGTTNGTVVFSVAANGEASSRTGAILVAGGGFTQTCTVVQAPFMPVLTIAPARTNLPFEAASGNGIEVTANVPWTATTNVPWIAITSGDSGPANGTVVFSVASNDLAAARTGAVIVASADISRTCTVVQMPFMPVLTIAPASTNQSFEAAGGNRIEVTANVPWTATTNVPWIAITSGDSGAANGTVIFSVASNGLATSRTGAVIVAGADISRTCTVIQVPFIPVLAITPVCTNLTPDAADGSSIAVVANVPWTATTDAPWLAITAGASGATNGVVGFSVASNGMATPRTGTIVVAGEGMAQTCTVNQAEAWGFQVDWHVATNGNDLADGRSWLFAKATIQSAIAAATNGSTVWVSNGVYATGGHVAGGALSNRVVIDKPIAVRSVHGFGVTSIRGAWDPANTDGLGGAAIRCAYVASNAVLSGFTLTNGATALAHGTYAGSGGGAFCEEAGVLADCLLIGNVAEVGGGSAGGTLRNCLLTGNWAKNSGGGSYISLLNNCSVSGNSAGTSGGGSSYGAMANSIVYGNAAPSSPNYTNCAFTNSCTAPDPAGMGNITNDPQFVDAAAGNFRLKTNSPCIDRGSNAYVQGTTDLDGNPRIRNHVVDMGAYEFKQPADWYITTNGNDSADGAAWLSAKATIQAAIDAALNDDTVWVSNGVYATGGRIAWSESGLPSSSNRLVIDKALTVQSINGPEVTIIQGAKDPTSANGLGDASVRCAFVGTNAVLTGFTLTNGATGTNSAHAFQTCGGGVVGNGILSNCTLTGNSALSAGGGSYYSITLNNCTLMGNSARYGGGAQFGTLNNCWVVSNSAQFSGGGAAHSTLNNCMVVGNIAHGYYGGGSVGGTLNNCTVVGNAANAGGGVASCVLNGCIVLFNTASTEQNYQGCSFNYCCTDPNLDGIGNITNDPQFVNAAAGNYRLRTNSPCIDAGDNSFVQGTTDLDGNPRIRFGAVDMGAYEMQYPVSYRAWASEITNGLTNDTDCAAGDGMPNLLKYAAGSSPMAADGLARLDLAFENGAPTLRFNRNPNATDVTLVIQGADEMSDAAEWRGLATNLNGSWGGAANVSEAGQGNPVACAVEDVVPLQTNRFLRLKVTRP